MEERGLLTADLFKGDEHGGVVVKRSLLAQRIKTAVERGEAPRPMVEFCVAPPPPSGND